MTTSTSTERTTPAAVEGFGALKPRVLYVGYHVNDIERALAFYVGVLGMKEQLRVPLGKGEHEVILGFPEGKSAGVILNARRPMCRVTLTVGSSSRSRTSMQPLRTSPSTVRALRCR
jgi:uncharacterized glyoxalase superfamily protein PhnB